MNTERTPTGPEHHPTYSEARDTFQRLADILPLVDRLCFIASGGETVQIGNIVRDALAEMFRLREMGAGVCKGTHVIVPKVATVSMCYAGAFHVAPLSTERGDDDEYTAAGQTAHLRRIWRFMIEAAQEQNQ